ncbi:hypothetical protein E5288_WYG012127 [Bos mutus]|uniref:Protein naked cuticle homolog n=1 Tax=Bos mutus TaxID=72004 RepID=A0A6B0R6V1_9CETA|nr:hypothetical protein [Bos mutus]
MPCPLFSRTLASALPGGTGFCSNLRSDLNSDLCADLCTDLHSGLYTGLHADLRSDLYTDLGSDLHADLCADLRSDLRADLCDDLCSDLYTDLHADLGSDLRSDLCADLRPDLRADLHSDLSSDLHADLCSDLYTDLHADLRSDLGSDLCADCCADLCSDLYTDLSSDLRADLHADLYADLRADLRSDLRSDRCADFCSDLYTDLSSDLCADLGSDLYTDLGSDLYTDLHADLRSDLRADLCSDLRSDLGSDLRADRCADLCSDLGSDLHADLRSDLGSGGRLFQGPGGDSIVVSAYMGGRRGAEEAERRGCAEHGARDKQELLGGDLREGPFRDNQCPLEVMLPPEKAEACEGPGQLFCGWGPGEWVKMNLRPPRAPQAVQCDVSVEEDDHQEWTFTLYGFDNSGKATREDMSSLMHTIYEVVDASVHRCSGSSKTLRVKLTVSPEPSSKRKDGPPAAQDREASRCRAEAELSEDPRVADRRLSAHVRRPNADPHPCSERGPYCVDENTERRNHYLDLAGIENYASKFGPGLCT